MASYALGGVAEYVAVAATSAGFTTPMALGRLYRFTSTTDCWVKVTTTGGAAQADTANNHLCLAGQQLILCNPDVNDASPSATTTTNAFVKVIRNTADGDATLSPLVALHEAAD